MGMRPLPAAVLAVVAIPLLARPAAAQRQEGDFVSHHIRFANGDTIAELRIHYTTLGRPTRDARGVVRNAVLLLHGTTGSGTGLERPMSPLFAPGAPPARRTRATASGCGFRSTPATTWWTRSIGWSPKGWESVTCGW